MPEDHDWVIARVSALPAAWWIQAASPRVFALARDINAAETTLRQDAPALAEAIGDRLVPRDEVDGEERGQILAARRHLHGGRPLGQAQINRVASLARRLNEPALAARLDSWAELMVTVAAIDAELDRSLDTERTRLLGLPAEIAAQSPYGTALFDSAELPGDRSLNRRSWRRFVRCWGLVARAAVIATPRGWFSHVTVLRTRESPDPPRVARGIGVCWTQSVRELRRSLTRASMIDEFCDIAVATNPLSWAEEQHRYGLVLDQLEEPSCVVLRETEFLAALLDAAARPQTLPQLCASLGINDAQDGGSLGNYVGQLLDSGILQASAPPLMTIRRTHHNQPPSPDGVVARTGGWVDVYRDPSVGISDQMVKDIRERTQAAVQFVSALAPPWRSGYGGTPDHWTVVDILKAVLARGRTPRDAQHVDEPVSSPPSRTGRIAELSAFLASQPADADVINIPHELISTITANTDDVTWPVDCLLRLPDPGLSAHGPVLAEIWPAATIDSRFADGLGALTGGLPGQAAYRDFLCRIEDLTGVQFVEIAVPPLSEAADNAVRRPGYTSAWTGDSAAATYFPPDAAPGEYIPLRDIELIRDIDGYRCFFQGRQLWPCYHATRTFSSPWDSVAHTLLMASPLAFPKHFRRPDILLGDVADAARMARIVLDGDIVLSPARWRLTPSDFWEPGAALRQRLRALERTRHIAGLPRWVYISDSDERSRTALDLESLPALEHIDTLLRHQSSLLVTEMLPAPDALLMGDDTYPSSRVASEIVVRLPADGELAQLAPKIAGRLTLTAP